MAKVLLIEDDLNLQEIYKARLAADGHEVSVSADGEEGLATAVKVKPDVILLDIMMPKISGFDVLDIIRQTPEIRDTKVIILTALSQEGDRERGEKLGADKYLVKSQITLEDVVAAVGEAVGRPPKETKQPAAPAAKAQDTTSTAKNQSSSPDDQDGAAVDQAVKKLKQNMPKADNKQPAAPGQPTNDKPSTPNNQPTPPARPATKPTKDTGQTNQPAQAAKPKPAADEQPSTPADKSQLADKPAETTDNAQDQPPTPGSTISPQE